LNPTTYDRVAQDFGIAENSTGAHGMSAEQVLRNAVIKQMEGYSYEEPAFHPENSKAFRTFCRFRFDERYTRAPLN